MTANGGLRQVVMLAAWLVVGSVGLLMLTQAVGWTGGRLVAVLQSLTPYLIVVLAPIAAAAAVRREHALGLTAALVGIGGVLLAWPLIVTPDQAPARDGAQGVTVASVNLLYTNDRIEDAAAVVLAQDADVVVFSEFTAEFQDALGAHPVVGSYPFRLERPGLRAGGTAVWSRFPLGPERTLDTENYTIDTVVDGPDDPFVVVTIHPPAPIFDYAAWDRDHAEFRRRAAAADEPTLLVGDFNASYWHPLFRRLLDTGFVDAHMAHGRGFSTSWPTGDWRPAFVRLDHALTGGGLVSTAVRDFDVPGSDHRGLVVTVAPAR